MLGIGIGGVMHVAQCPRLGSVQYSSQLQKVLLYMKLYATELNIDIEFHIMEFYSIMFYSTVLEAYSTI